MKSKIEISVHTAHVILGALSVCYDEGVDGIDPNSPSVDEDACHEAKFDLVAELIKLYPELTDSYYTPVRR